MSVRDPYDVYEMHEEIEEKDAEIEKLRAEVERLKGERKATLGVGSGDGKLFVHGSYEAIKECQNIILEKSRLRSRAEQAEAKINKMMPFVLRYCELYPCSYMTDEIREILNSGGSSE